ncbi:SDR family oxidoreductase [Prauserella alba]|uniref:SDR family oxidoreductase n=1 Tax=Prauserella alba TaxID=176898 RepID=A0ABP4FUW5_9PSEU|nr:SDR family oxidoreductase [Prauserella alba]MCP2181392.1 NAD(P)-dependent dehydrogenase, short-chain alcohol dehydrogenase family [Prauserella alba]
MTVLAGKVVVVSGAGPGLGRAIAVRSAHAGADVALVARDGQRLGKVAAEVRELGRRVLTVPADITDDDACARIVDSTLAEFGRVDALVNNAFAMPPMTDLTEVRIDKLRAGLDVNVFAALRLTRRFAPRLAPAGSVVMINSAVLRHSRQLYGAYKMAKSALLSVSQSLASELGPSGVRVNSVAPGYIWADMLQAYFAHLASERGVDPQQVYDDTAATTDLRRLPEPDEIADAVVFLASPMARAITGQCLDVNAGEFHH